MRLFDTVILPGIILLVIDGIFLGLNREMFKLQVAEVQRVVLEIKYLGVALCYAIFDIRAFIISS